MVVAVAFPGPYGPGTCFDPRDTSAAEQEETLRRGPATAAVAASGAWAGSGVESGAEELLSAPALEHLRSHGPFRAAVAVGVACVVGSAILPDLLTTVLGRRGD